MMEFDLSEKTLSKHAMFRPDLQPEQGGADWRDSQVMAGLLADAPSGSGSGAMTGEEANAAPIAVDNTASMSENIFTLTQEFNVLLNDSDPDGDTLEITGIDTTGAIGAWSFDPAGKIVYDTSTNNIPGDPYDYLRENESLTETIAYTVSDGKGGTDTATLTVTVNGVNDAPRAEDDRINVPFDGTITLMNVRANDADPEGAPLTFTNVFPSFVNGVQTNPKGAAFLIGGSLYYNPNGEFDDLTHGQAAIERFSYTVTDGEGRINSAVLTVVVNGPNQAPTAFSDLYGFPNGISEDESGSIGFEVLDDDSDPDGDSLAVTAIDTSGTIGEWSISPFGASIQLKSTDPFQYLSAGETLDEQLTYTVSDGNGGAATATLQVRFQGENDAPVARDETFFITENHDLKEVIKFSPLDDPEGDTVEIISIDDAETVGRWGINAADNSITYGPSLEVFDYLSVGETYTESISYTISDGNGGAATGTLTAMVLGENDAPVAAPDRRQEVSEDSRPVLIDVLANDLDPEGDALTVISADTEVTQGVVLIEDGKLYYTPGAAFQSLNEGETGADLFTYVISDGNGGVSASSVEIIVNGADEAPGNTGPGAVDDAPAPILESAGPTVIDVLTNDFASGGGALAVTGLDSTRTIGRVTLDGDGVVRYDPDGKFAFLGDGQSAADSFRYFVADGDGGVSEATVTVTINGEGVPGPTGFTGGDDVVIGSDGPDVFAGRPGDDWISGGAGDDVITGGSGDDTIFGDAGDDELRGNSGADEVYGGDGDDQIFGGGDVDVLFGEAGDDTIVGVTGDDLIFGGAGADNLFGRADNDFLDGGAGDDRLTGNQGDDALIGGDGRDVMVGSGGDDSLTGGQGADVFVFLNERGMDVITDFETGADRINLAKRSFGARELQFSDLELIQDGDDAIVKDRGLEIRLVGVNIADLGEGDFIF